MGLPGLSFESKAFWDVADTAALNPLTLNPKALNSLKLSGREPLTFRIRATEPAWLALMPLRAANIQKKDFPKGTFFSSFLRIYFYMFI